MTSLFCSIYNDNASFVPAIAWVRTIYTLNYILTIISQSLQCIYAMRFLLQLYKSVEL